MTFGVVVSHQTSAGNTYFTVCILSHNPLTVMGNLVFDLWPDERSYRNTENVPIFVLYAFQRTNEKKTKHWSDVLTGNDFSHWFKVDDVMTDGQTSHDSCWMPIGRLHSLRLLVVIFSLESATDPCWQVIGRVRWRRRGSVSEAAEWVSELICAAFRCHRTDVELFSTAGT